MDIDGVVNEEVFANFTEFGISTEQMQPFWHGPFAEALIGTADTKEIIQPFLQEWGWQGTIDEFFDHWHQEEHKTSPEMVNLINELKSQSIIVCAATNQEQYRTEYLKNAMGYDQLFDHVFSSCELGYKKPDPAFFTTILDHLSIAPEEVLFFDNTQKHVDGALSLGIKAHFFKSPEQCREIIGRYITLER